jgi:arsenate reductase-like glutaredoxin family protein
MHGQGQMLKFFRISDCAGCKAIEEVLTELCIAHKVILISEDNTSQERLPEGVKPPVLVDEEEIIQGNKLIIEHLEKLKDFKELWYKFQSDACYCDEMD